MTNPILSVSRLADVSISIESSAESRKAEALECAALVKGVANEADQELCVGALTDIKRLLKEVESSRALVKAPVLDLGRKIDDVARTFTVMLYSEAARLETALSTYQAEQRRIALEAEAKRQAELRRIEAEKLAAEQAARLKAEEERRKAQAELDLQEAERRAMLQEQLAKAKSEKEAGEARQRAEIERQQAAKAAEEHRLAMETQARVQASQAVQRAEQQALAIAPAPVQAKPDGLTVKGVWKFEVLDAHKAYLERPSFFELKVRALAVNEAIRQGMRECPGIRVWKETKAGVRL